MVSARLQWQWKWHVHLNEQQEEAETIHSKTSTFKSLHIEICGYNAIEKWNTKRTSFEIVPTDKSKPFSITHTSALRLKQWIVIRIVLVKCMWSNENVRTILSDAIRIALKELSISTNVIKKYQRSNKTMHCWILFQLKFVYFILKSLIETVFFGFWATAI